VGQLIFAGDPTVSVAEISPWWDMRIVPEEVRDMVRAQAHRRVIKTHLPADALRMSPKAKYIYVARDGRDVAWSLHNHHLNHSELAFELINNTPGRVGPPLPKADPDVRRYFNYWLETDGGHHWSFWENTATWWALRDQPNVKLVHFNDLKADLPAVMRDIAEFLEIDLTPAQWADAIEHCTFDWMKANSHLCAPLGGMPWEGGSETFINKGTNGRWKDVLSVAESQAYEEIAVEKLGGACARWLATGQRV